MNDVDQHSQASTDINHEEMFEIPPRSIFHYEIPNLSNMLYEYTNKEKDIIE